MSREEQLFLSQLYIFIIVSRPGGLFFTTSRIYFKNPSKTYDRINNTEFRFSQEIEVEDDLEEKAKLISQVLELQNTLEDLSSRVDNVKEENLRLRSENQVRTGGQGPTLTRNDMYFVC